MRKFISIFSWEPFLIFCIAFYALFLAKFPTIYHGLNTPSGYWFVGHISWFDAWDVQVYLSAIRYGQGAGVFLQNTYTAIPHEGVLIYQYYTLLGLLNRVLNFPIISVFHISSLLSSIFLIIVSYIIIENLIKDKFIRIAAFATAIVGGGLGWIPNLHTQALDFTSAGFTTLNAFERGHDALSTAFLILSFFLFIKFSQSKNIKTLSLAIMFGLLNSAIHPPFVPLYLIAGSLIAIIQYLTDKKKIVFIFPAAIAGIFSIYYLIFLSGLSANPGFAGIVQQQLNPVKFYSILFGFGLLTPLLARSLFNLLDENLELLYVKILFVTQLVFLFSPIGPSLYFLKGLFFWGVLIAYYGIQTLIRKKRTKTALIFIVLISSLLSRVWIFNSQMNIDKNNSFFFLKSAESDTLNYMQTLPVGNVLSLYRIGNYIPAHTDHHVYFGHYLQTPNGREKLQTALSFYSSMTNSERDEFINMYNINYIYYGLEETLARNNEDPSLQNYLLGKKAIYKKSQISIYKL